MFSYGHPDVETRKKVSRLKSVTFSEQNAVNQKPTAATHFLATFSTASGPLPEESDYILFLLVSKPLHVSKSYGRFENFVRHDWQYAKPTGSCGIVNVSKAS